MSARIRIGIGGWNFAPWRANFYPPGLAQSRELAWASRQLSAIEINATFYSSFKPASFARWRDETPDDFVFSLKAHRFATHRRELATAGESVRRFIGSGLTELGPKLGPIVWQLMPGTVFDAAQVDAFLALLPREADGLALQHVIDARHPSFACEAFLELLERHGAGAVHTDSDKFPAIIHARSPLAYLRLMRSQADCPTGYPPDQLERWAQGARAWVAQGPDKQCHLFFINGAKERAPAAARALIGMLEGARAASAGSPRMRPA